MGQWKDKNTGKWTAKFVLKGRECRKKGFKTRAKARDWESSKREELTLALSMTPSISLQELGTMYLNDCQARLRKNTWRQKRFVYQSFISFLGDGSSAATSVTTRQISEFLNARAARDGNKAANRDLRDLKALYNWGIDREIFDVRNPCKKIPKFPEEPYIPYVPPAEDIAAVRMAAGQDERDFIEVVYHALARRIEVVRLTWEDVNFEQRWIRLFTRKRRGGQLDPVYKPINKTLYNVLYSRWQRRNKTIPYVFKFNSLELRHMMSRLCKKAKVKPFGFHAIRHHVASVVNDSGKATTKQIQGLLGHKRQATTEIYLHTIGVSLHAAAGILDWEETGESQQEEKQNGALNGTHGH